MSLPLLFSVLAVAMSADGEAPLPPPPLPVMESPPDPAPTAPVGTATPAPADAVAPVAAPGPSPKRRVEIVASLGIAAGGSDWSTDPLGYGSLTLGLRLFRAVTPFGMVRLGYANVDQRLLTFLSVGLQLGYPVRGKAYPYGRIAFVHQHEESLAAVADNAGGALLGIGTGIRHRAGAQGTLGCDFVLTTGKRGDLVLGPEVMVAYLGYSSGPNLYGAVGVQLGGSLTLF